MSKPTAAELAKQQERVLRLALQPCDFCDKPRRAVRFMIQAPYRRAYICDECVDFCKTLVDEKRKGQSP